ncbi:DUF6882 domain-containing protein [Microbispora sp. CA-102843]|uniref:DUF6882 domain-containing protein n=1 Tax=Microbispora sp. CA-102843 TaxID=3239952 RepID=UPI003D91A28F
MSNLRHHLSLCVASSLVRQSNLGDLIGEHNWAVDITTGTITFGESLSFPIQLLGTESDDDRTWLWAWANTRSNIPHELVHAVAWLREYGHRHHIPELTEATLPLDHADGHTLALLSAGLTGLCYYRGPYQGGAAYFLLQNVPHSVLAPTGPEDVVPVLSQIMEMYDLDHRTLVENFLIQQGWHVQTTQATLVGRHPGGSNLHLEFDEHGRAGGIRLTFQHD